MITPVNIGKHKIPRYIYHLTTQRNYNSMLKDGFIKTSDDSFCGKGVFCIELTNFFKRWKKHSDWGNSNLQLALIRQVKKAFSDGLVLLKIPTRNLEPEKLKIRSQNRAFSWVKRNLETLTEIENSNIEDKTTSYINFLYSSTNRTMADHIHKGSPAQESSLYKKRKEAIEYIYNENIPVDKIEAIGEISAPLTRFFLNSQALSPIKNIFLELLKEHNEIKGAKLLK